ncbi:MAG: YHYH protein, partial [Verrucomicrobiota bacterium]
MRLITPFLFACTAVTADPLLTSWYMDASRHYARIYRNADDQLDQAPQLTWLHPNSGTGQAETTYSGIHEVSYNANFVYVRSSGLGSHVMGPWWRDNENPTEIFGNWPGSSAFVMSFPRLADPRTPTIPQNRTLTGGGAIGMFVDGVAMFDARDTLSWSPQDQADGNVGGTIVGTGYWERDAYVNEGPTFDAAFAHQAGETYHYHANPPALRHQLGDSVDYNPALNEYSEIVGGNGEHSPILGWVRDGLPIYGPYGYSDPMDSGSPVRRMISGFRIRLGLETPGAARTSFPDWVVRYRGVLPDDEYGPDVSPLYPSGHYLQDYEYLGDVGYTIGVDFDLDEYNTRFCVTPEFPGGVRAYFVSITADGSPQFPYNVGRRYYANPRGGNFNNSDNRQNNDFVDPGDRIVFAEGGPESPIKDVTVRTQSLSDDIIISWVGVEGGMYEVTSTSDLINESELRDEVIYELSAGQAIGEYVDASALAVEDIRFYRVTRESVMPFDDEGYSLDRVQERDQRSLITVILSSPGPDDLAIEPNSLLLDGEAVEFISRSSPSEITFAYYGNALEGGETLSALFPGDTVPVTGVYEYLIPQGTGNILFILVDDWGIDSSPIDNISGAFQGIAGSGGQDLPDMPNLVQLANESIRFSNAYVQSSCSPTRLSIMTGKGSYATGVGAPGAAVNTRDSTQTMTIAEAIDFVGSPYATGLMGKWHLGSGTGITGRGPGAEGWDVFWGSIQGNLSNYFDWTRSDVHETVIDRSGVFINAEGFSEDPQGQILDTTGDIARETNYATTVNTDDAIDFIGDQGTDPWLCWIGYNAPHSQSEDPRFPVPPVNGTGSVEMNGEVYGGTLDTNRDRYKAALWALDSEIGRLLSYVDLDNTTVILLGDNGTPAGQVQDDNLFPSDHAKGTIFVGGVHVPCIIRPAGGLSTPRVIESPIQGVDLFPTMCALMGIDPTSLGQVLDGQSLVPLMNGISNPDRIVFAETFGGGNDGRTLRKGDYKLNIFDDPRDDTDVPSMEFYDLSQSLEENPTNDLLRVGNVLSAEETSVYEELLAENERLSSDEINFMTDALIPSEFVTTSVDLTGVTGLQNGEVIA